MFRVTAIVVLVLLACTAGASGDIADRQAPHGLAYEEARSANSPSSPSSPSRAPLRAAASWCGAPTQKDREPGTVTGHLVHWLYVIPSDGQDRFSKFATQMQADADSIDSWWRGQDPHRAPRNDLAQFACGTQLDISLIRLSRPGSQLESIESRFAHIADGLADLQFSSPLAKYLVYYDGPVEPEICGEGGNDATGLDMAVVYVQACPGVPRDTTAAHELLHTLGAVADGAHHMCPAPEDGHVCDNRKDLMFPVGNATPLARLALDPGRDDYYGHSGSWPNVLDSPWLVELDGQLPLALEISGPGSVEADARGLHCAQTCTTTWRAGTTIALRATPAAGAKLVHWGGACSGSAECTVAVDGATTVSALFAPAAYRLTVAISGRGSVRSSRPGTSCALRCSSLVSSYETIRLIPAPAEGWRFEQWRGACRGEGLCSVPMTGLTSIRGVFVRV